MSKTEKLQQIAFIAAAELVALIVAVACVVTQEGAWLALANVTLLFTGAMFPFTVKRYVRTRYD